MATPASQPVRSGRPATASLPPLEVSSQQISDLRDREQRLLAEAEHAASGGLVRLRDLVELLPAGTAGRSLIYSLERAAVAVPVSRTRGQRQYTVPAAVDLLLSAEMVAMSKTTVAEAARLVRAYRDWEAGHQGNHLFGAQLTSAGARVSRIVQSRVLTALALSVYGVELTGHSNLMIMLVPDDPADHPPLSESGKVAWARRAVRRPDVVAGVMSGGGDLFLFTERPTWEIDAAAVMIQKIKPPPGGRGYTLAVISIRSASDDKPGDELRPASPTPEWHAVAAQLAYVCTTGVGWLAGHIARLAVYVPTEKRPTRPLSAEVNMQLWLLMKLLCFAASVMPPHDAANDLDGIYGEVLSAIPGERGVLRFRVSTELLPWEPPPGPRYELPAGWLVSGYVLNTRLPLHIDGSTSPLAALISQGGWEARQVKGRVEAFGAHTLGRSGAEEAVVYLYRQHAALNNDTITGVLTVLAPIALEILDREHIALRTAQLAAVPLAEIGQESVAPFAERLTAAIRRAWKKYAGDDTIPADEDGRVALCVLKFIPEDGANRPAEWTWLQGEQRRPLLGAILSAWHELLEQWWAVTRADEGDDQVDRSLRVAGLKAEAGHALRGSLDVEQAVILWPGAILTRPELVALRDAVARRVNRQGMVRAPGGTPIAALHAWVVDVSLREATALLHHAQRAAAIDVDAESPDLACMLAEECLRRAKEAAAVLPELVRTWRAFEQAEWDKGSSACARGLRLQPRNAYLLRMQAQFSILRGDFARAETAALGAAAIVGDCGGTDARPWCLLGEARLGQGRLVEALDALHNGRRLNPRDPQPLISAGAALSGAAQVLRLWCWEQLHPSQVEIVGDCLTTLRRAHHICERLAMPAAALFNAGQQLRLPQIGVQHRESRFNSRRRAVAYLQARATELLSERHRLRDAMTDAFESELPYVRGGLTEIQYYDAIVATMHAQGAGPVLFNTLNDDKVLQAIAALVDQMSAAIADVDSGEKASAAQRRFT